MDDRGWRVRSYFASYFCAFTAAPLYCVFEHQRMFGGHKVDKAEETRKDAVGMESQGGH
jgi:hypothetical protein